MCRDELFQETWELRIGLPDKQCVGTVRDGFLFLLERGPMLGQQGRVRPAKERVLPFLDLRLEVTLERRCGPFIGDALQDVCLERIK